jgi:hypothetical protein
VAVTAIVTGALPQLNVMTPPLVTAALSALNVQLAALPVPTTVVGLEVSAGLPPVGMPALHEPSGFPAWLVVPAAPAEPAPAVPAPAAPPFAWPPFAWPPFAWPPFAWLDPPVDATEPPTPAVLAPPLPALIGACPAWPRAPLPPTPLREPPEPPFEPPGLPAGSLLQAKSAGNDSNVNTPNQVELRILLRTYRDAAEAVHRSHEAKRSAVLELPRGQSKRAAEGCAAEQRGA